MGTGDGNVHSAKLDTARSLRPDEPRPRSRRPLYTARGTRTRVRAARRGIRSRDGRGIAGKAAVSAVLVQQTPNCLPNCRRQSRCTAVSSARAVARRRKQTPAPNPRVGYRPDQARPAECYTANSDTALTRAATQLHVGARRAERASTCKGRPIQATRRP